ncbi:MAG: Cupin domain protein [Promethearchaeota archaeon]|jgi:mannose-6-phosphate isomerase-like protein (cupin superfamily)|nr:MAG: Cupin domain protein [Candidatus Lokiarchaeota archaeon]
MKRVSEQDFEYRDGDSGVKYLMRGPSIDWGVIKIMPGDKMADKAHGHNIIDETFYFMEGDGIMLVDKKEYKAPEGSVFLIEPKEMHNIRNDSSEPIKVIFIKGDYKPDDKI